MQQGGCPEPICILFTLHDETGGNLLTINKLCSIYVLFISFFSVIVSAKIRISEDNTKQNHENFVLYCRAESIMGSLWFHDNDYKLRCGYYRN